jgi:hypothetical protein
VPTDNNSGPGAKDADFYLFGQPLDNYPGDRRLAESLFDIFADAVVLFDETGKINRLGKPTAVPGFGKTYSLQKRMDFLSHMLIPLP